MNLIQASKQWLSNSHIIVPDDWLQACVDWIHEENQGAQLAQDVINSQVYEQWLLSDLHELETQCLPDEITSASKFELTGAYALQIDSILDVGKSFYSQQQKCKGTENANTRVTAEEPEVKPWEMKPTRMLMMKLTDGKQIMQGMEYKPITSLSPQTPPGAKILVHGTILCRHGILMLSENSVQLLGGEVDTLVESNTMLNTLQAAMDAGIEHAEKHYRQEFRGSEITHSQKPNASQKPTASQLQPRQQQHQSWRGTGAVKQEVQSQKYNPVKTEPISQRINGRHERNTTTQAEMDDQWGDDAELMDAFMDDMDMDDFDPPVTQNVSNSGMGNNSASRHTGFTSAGNVMRTSNSESSGSSALMGTSRKSNSTAGNMSGNSRNAHFTKEESSMETNRGNCGTGVSVRNRNGVAFGSNNNSNVQDSFHNSNSRQSSKITKKSESKVQSAMDSFMRKKTPALSNGGTSSRSVGKNLSLGKSSSIVLDDFANDMDFEDEMDDMDLENIQEQTNTRTKTTSKQTNTISKAPLDSQQARISRVSTDVGRMGENSGKRNIEKARSSGNVSAKMKGLAKMTDNTGDSVLVTTNKQPERQPQYLLGNSDSISLKVKEEPQQIDMKPSIDSKVESNYPFTYISRLLSLPKQEQPTVHTVKAYISTLISRLSTDTGKWSLACKINDGTMAIDVDISDKVLTEMIGFSCEQSKVMRVKAKQDPKVKEVLKKGIQNFQQKLVDLMCLLELEVSSRYTRPVVVATRPITTNDINMLYNRVMASWHKFTHS